MFTDIKLVSCKIDVQSEDEVKSDNGSMIEYMTSVPQFDWRSGMVKQWAKYEEYVYDID